MRRQSIREKCLREIKRLDPKLKHPEESHAAVFLLTALHVGPRLGKIMRASGLDPELCRRYFHNAQYHKIFRGSKIACEWFEENGGIAFWCDTFVLDGLLEKVHDA